MPRMPVGGILARLDDYVPPNKRPSISIRLAWGELVFPNLPVSFFPSLVMTRAAKTFHAVLIGSRPIHSREPLAL